MSEQLEKMQNLYESLANQLSEATVHPESLSQFFDCISNWKLIWRKTQIVQPTWLPFWRSQRESIQNSFVQCTKLDVAMNSLLQRSKTLGKNSFKQRDVSDTYFSSYPEQTQLLDVALKFFCRASTGPWNRVLPLRLHRPVPRSRNPSLVPKQRQSLPASLRGQR